MTDLTFRGMIWKCAASMPEIHYLGPFAPSRSYKNTLGRVCRLSRTVMFGVRLDSFQYYRRVDVRIPHCPMIAIREHEFLITPKHFDHVSDIIWLNRKYSEEPSSSFIQWLCGRCKNSYGPLGIWDEGCRHKGPDYTTYPFQPKSMSRLALNLVAWTPPKISSQLKCPRTWILGSIKLIAELKVSELFLVVGNFYDFNESHRTNLSGLYCVRRRCLQISLLLRWKLSSAAVSAYNFVGGSGWAFHDNHARDTKPCCCWRAAIDI